MARRYLDAAAAAAVAQRRRRAVDGARADLFRVSHSRLHASRGFRHGFGQRSTRRPAGLDQRRLSRGLLTIEAQTLTPPFGPPRRRDLRLPRGFATITGVGAARRAGARMG